MRMPSGLFDTYKQYKQDTRAVIAWLAHHGSAQHVYTAPLTVRDLFGFATVVRSKGTEMSDTIAFHFRAAIAARTRLSRSFRKHGVGDNDDRETCDHEHFTASLSELYRYLSGHDWRHPMMRARSQDATVCKHPPLPTPNPFTVLTANHDDMATLQADAEDPCCHEHTPCLQVKHARSHAETHFCVDDSLGTSLEIRQILQDADDLLRATTVAWAQAAQGQTPLVVAALLSSTAFEELRIIEQRLGMLCDISNPADTRAKVNQAFRCMTSQEDSGCPCWLHPLLSSWQSLHDLKIEGPASAVDMTPSSGAHSFVLLRKGSDSAPVDENCLNVLLHAVIQHLKAQSFLSNTFHSTCQAVTEIRSHLVGDNPHALRSSFGLWLLLSSCKSYCFATENKLAASSCRLQALQFAQRAMPSIAAVLEDATMPCRCPDTLASLLARLHTDLDTFVHAKCFDLYFQSPWVSGSHILSMLEALFYYGLRLFSYRDYVGSVMHTYNILRQMTGLEAIPVLEHLSNTFQSILNPGGRPSRNFTA
ncbi:hypothetical protein LTR53_017884, partial [Teratosphaeriaceae sp. CCFEE 6253]